jgi:hypothetical protein
MRRGLTLAVAIVLGACATASPSAQTPALSECFEGEALYQDLRTYTEMGFKTSGSPTDHRVADWMANNLAGHGLSLRTGEVKVRQFFPQMTRVEVGDLLVGAYPVWFPKPTDSQGAVGRLRSLEDAGDGDVVLVQRLPRDSSRDEIPLRDQLRQAAAAGAEAAIVVIPFAPGDWSATNTYVDTPIPAVVVGGRHLELLEAAAAEGTQTRVTIRGEEASEAEVKWIEGRKPGAAVPGSIIAISTPLSAFTQAGGERGPGVALLRGIACWVAESPRRHTFMLVAPGGHEIQGVGMQHYLDHEAPPKESVHSWLHLGASIAVYDWVGENSSFAMRNRQSPHTRLLTNSERLRAELEVEFAGFPYKPRVASSAVGYLRRLFEVGYPTWGFEGAGAFHHLPTDDADNTSPELLETAGRAIERMLVKLDAQD